MNRPSREPLDGVNVEATFGGVVELGSSAFPLTGDDFPLSQLADVERIERRLCRRLRRRWIERPRLPRLLRRMSEHALYSRRLNQRRAIDRAHRSAQNGK